ncbi:MAG: excalibur calcium-binding domain-containing protein [Fibrobacteria bacterium]
MNKAISFAFLAIFVFYGFHRCSKIHPAEYFDKPAKAGPTDTAAQFPPLEPTEMGNPFLDPSQEEIRKSLDARNEAARVPPTVKKPETPRDSRQESSGVFACRGKVYCSEMESCEEAEFYQRNCPGMNMDGDGDGKPCEDRCGH